MSCHVIKRASLTVSPGIQIPIIIANQCSGSPLMWSCYNPSTPSSPQHAQDPITRAQVPAPTSPPMGSLAVVFSAGVWLPRRSALFKSMNGRGITTCFLYGGVCWAETRPPPCRGKTGDTAPHELFLNHPGNPQLTDRSNGSHPGTPFLHPLPISPGTH